MSYIGKSPAVGNFVKLDAISTSSTNTYNLTVDSVAFTPESANHMLVSLNGVIQAPLTSFSVSGSTITFLPSSGTLSSSDSIDFIMVYGNVLDIGTPSDSTVTNAKTNFVSTSSSAGLQIKGDNTTAGTLQLNCEQNSHGIKLRSPAHSSGQSYTIVYPTSNITAGKFLKVDSVSGSGATGVGQLSFADAGGITMADQWRITAHTNQGSNAIISTNWERNDSTGFGYIGSGMSESSGVFSFPSTGFYLVTFEAKFYLDGNDTAEVWIQVTTNNSSYSGVAVGNSTNTSGSANDGYSSSSSTIVDVTDTSNVKVNFLTGSMAGNTKMLGNSTYNLTTATFIRLGDT